MAVRSRLLATFLSAATLATLAPLPRPAGLPVAHAKEPDAACPVLPTLLTRIRATLMLAAVQRARGSSLAAYRVLRTNAELLLDDKAIAACGTVPRIFRRALARAGEAPSAMAASLALDVGFAAALSVALTGHMPSDDERVKAIDTPEASHYGEGCADLFALTRRLEPGADLPRRAAALRADLERQPRCKRLREALTAPPERLEDAVDLALLDEPEVTPQSPIARCPELPMVLDRLSSAVTAGAPLYNRGEHEACRRLYELTARALSGRALPARHCPVVRAELEKALALAAAAGTPGDAAWELRRGFDRIAGTVDGGDTQAAPGGAPSLRL
jgi:hypothetical protein